MTITLPRQTKVHKSKLSIIDFQEKFNTKDKCHVFLFELHFPQGFVFSECGCAEYYHIKNKVVALQK